MRAIIEHHGEAAKSYPPIQTLVVKGKEDLSIRITDLGGGIPQSKLNHVFKYMYSTAPRPNLTSDVYNTQSNAPLVYTPTNMFDSIRDVKFNLLQNKAVFFSFSVFTKYCMIYFVTKIENFLETKIFLKPELLYDFAYLDKL